MHNQKPMFQSFGIFKGISDCGGFVKGDIGGRFIHRGKKRRAAIRHGRGWGK